jgi:hypothetical protein
VCTPQNVAIEESTRQFHRDKAVQQPTTAGGAIALIAHTADPELAIRGIIARGNSSRTQKSSMIGAITPSGNRRTRPSNAHSCSFSTLAIAVDRRRHIVRPGG